MTKACAYVAGAAIAGIIITDILRRSWRRTAAKAIAGRVTAEIRSTEGWRSATYWYMETIKARLDWMDALGLPEDDPDRLWFQSRLM